MGSTSLRSRSMGMGLQKWAFIHCLHSLHSLAFGQIPKAVMTAVTPDARRHKR